MQKILKLAIAAGSLTLLFWGVEWHSLPGQLEDIYWWAVGVAFLGFAVQFIISGWKWSFALRLLDCRLPASFLVRIYCIGHFVGQFLPSGLGGDAYRIYRTRPCCTPTSRAVSAVAVERLFGFGVLLLLGGLGGLCILHSFIADVILVVLALIGTALLLGIAVSRDARYRAVTARLRRYSLFQAVEDNVQRLRTAGWRWIPFACLSIVFQVTAISIIYILFQAVDEDVSAAVCAVIAAAAGMATVLPISINGIGIVEGSFVGMAVALEVDYDAALLVAVLMRLVVLPLSVACGALYLVQPVRRNDTTSFA